MLVVIRADASETIGSGHIMRCLTLAERLRLKGAEVSFICRDFSGNLVEHIRNKGFKVHLLSKVGGENLSVQSNGKQKWLGTDWNKDADEAIAVLAKYKKKIDLIIVDQYGIDYKWQSRIRAMTQKIMVIDDLANRRHACDILLDQNFFEYPSARYSYLVPQNCRMLLGPHYALLRSEFIEARLNSGKRDGRVQRLIVFLAEVILQMKH